jgi:tetratricopeptide (TPR) repeat protein
LIKGKLQIKPIAIVLLATLLTACASGGTKNKSLEDLKAADDAYRVGMLSEAEARYTRVVKHNPNYYEAWFKLGNIYTRLGQYPASFRAYGKCIEIDPERGKGWYNLSMAKLLQTASILQESTTKVPESADEYRRIEALRSMIVMMVSSNHEKPVESTQ